ncbi:MAG: hypothetical protein GX181_08170 [Synergistaceae bacterium]|nr:hypothetical protein [Synergistota bacterium]NLM71916.1 hypothetical protein [Synergistaceae bacterium]
MRHFLVDVKSIRCAGARSEFDPEVVERLADSILRSGGLVKPLVLLPSGPMTYEVVGRRLEYWAAVRAREKDPRAGEMVNSYIIEPESAGVVERQLTILRSTETKSRMESDSAGGLDESAFEEIASRLTSIERAVAKCATLEQLEEALRKTRDSIESSVASAKPASRKRAAKREFNKDGPYDQENLSAATVPALKEFASSSGISFPGRIKKQELINLILAHYQTR